MPEEPKPVARRKKSMAEQIRIEVPPDSEITSVLGPRGVETRRTTPKASPAHKPGPRRRSIGDDMSYQQLKHPVTGAAATISAILAGILDLVSPQMQAQDVQLPNESGQVDPTIFERMLKQEGLIR